jgi:hypothetical protein
MRIFQPVYVASPRVEPFFHEMAFMILESVRDLAASDLR